MCHTCLRCFRRDQARYLQIPGHVGDPTTWDPQPIQSVMNVYFGDIISSDTYVEDRIALGTTLRDRRASVRLEVKVDIALVAHVLNHATERLLVVGLTACANIVYSCLAGTSAEARLQRELKQGQRT